MTLTSSRNIQGFALIRAVLTIYMLFLGLISTDLVAKGDQLKRKVIHAEVPPPNPGAHPGTNDIAVLTLSEPLDFDSEEPWPTSGLPICTGRFFLGYFVL